MNLLNILWKSLKWIMTELKEIIHQSKNLFEKKNLNLEALVQVQLLLKLKFNKFLNSKTIIED